MNLGLCWSDISFYILKLFYDSFLVISSSRSSPPNSSAAIERTEVLRNPEDMINSAVENFSRLKKSIDTCCNENGVIATIKTKPIWEGYVALKNKGIK